MRTVSSVMSELPGLKEGPVANRSIWFLSMMEETQKTRRQRNKKKKGWEIQQNPQQQDAQVWPSHRPAGRRACLPPLPEERETGVPHHLQNYRRQEDNWTRRRERVRAQEEVWIRAWAEEQTEVQKQFGPEKYQRIMEEENSLKRALGLDFLIQPHEQPQEQLIKTDTQLEEKPAGQQTQAAEESLSDLQQQLKEAQKLAEQQAKQIQAIEEKNKALHNNTEQLNEDLQREKNLSAQAEENHQAAMLELRLKFAKSAIQETDAKLKADAVKDALRKEQEETEKAKNITRQAVEETQKAVEKCLATQLALKQAEEKLEKHLLQWQQERAELIKAKNDTQRAMEDKEREWAERERFVLEKIADLERDMSENLEKKKKKKRGLLRRLADALTPSRKERKKKNKEDKMESTSN